MAYGVISTMMDTHHDISLSDNAIRKRLKRYGHPSRLGPTTMTEHQLQEIIRNKLKYLPRTVGYRQLTDVLKHEGFHVRRDKVMKSLRDVDPDGVQFRRRRRMERRTYTSLGPYHTWHIDGYSRKIIWLKMGPSNNDPKQVAYHYMTCLKIHSGFPLLIQADRGTENSVVGALQYVFRGGDEHTSLDRRMCFQHLSSKLNQRIEAWWSMFRRRKAQWWMDFFRDLVNAAAFDPSDEKAMWEAMYSTFGRGK
ncbi:uncharacterized protein LOC110442441 [Mizuhopecten yessoensis]|uniref:uncharacterized protein LOC110442441 n=1 Tax=Mizuhopecten yessoensis TaxID=6573 RepID=UPI000B45D2E2|nr:uncharacterized protein LOC110442441 [Mizuhopecten yessoensis]